MFCSGTKHKSQAMCFVVTNMCDSWCCHVIGQYIVGHLNRGFPIVIATYLPFTFLDVTTEVTGYSISKQYCFPGLHK